MSPHELPRITEDGFPTLVGKAIHQCGALEFLTNGAIAAHGRDSILVEEAMKLPFSARIRILRRLLHRIPKLMPADIDALCAMLGEIAQTRNEIAHNPIASDAIPAGTERILVVRHAASGTSICKEIGRDELQALVERSGEAIRRFMEFVPGRGSEVSA